MKISKTSMIAATIGMVAIFAPLAGAQSADGKRSPADDARASGSTCIVEAAALVEVADLAYRFGEDQAVLAGSLDELREQLLDCLSSGPDDGRQSSSPWITDHQQLRRYVGLDLKP